MDQLSIMMTQTVEIKGYGTSAITHPHLHPHYLHHPFWGTFTLLKAGETVAHVHATALPSSASLLPVPPLAHCFPNTVSAAVPFHWTLKPHTH